MSRYDTADQGHTLGTRADADVRTRAQLTLATIALDQPDPHAWLAEILDLLGLRTPPTGTAGYCTGCTRSLPISAARTGTNCCRRCTRQNSG